MITNAEIHENLAGLRALHLVFASAHQLDDGRHHIACYPSRVLPDRRSRGDELIAWADRVALISYKSTRGGRTPAAGDFYVIPLARVLPAFRATAPNRPADGG